MVVPDGTHAARQATVTAATTRVMPGERFMAATVSGALAAHEPLVLPRDRRPLTGHRTCPDDVGVAYRPGMKKCAMCGQTKPSPEFNRSARNRDGLHSYCRDCHKRHYRENAERHGRNVRRTSRARLATMRKVVAEALSGGCVDCGTSDIRVLEFDHVRGVKLDSISSLIRRGRSIATVRAEIEKCEVRCANCHAIATLMRLGTTWHDHFKSYGALGRN